MGESDGRDRWGREMREGDEGDRQTFWWTVTCVESVVIFGNIDVLVWHPPASIYTRDNTATHTDPMSTAELDELLLVVKNTIYRIPSAAVHHDRRSPVDVSFERFSQMARSSRALMSIDAFMGASDVGRSGYSSKNIFAVDTSEGWVWCSRFQVQVPEDESKACNLGHSLVGASFIW